MRVWGDSAISASSFPIPPTFHPPALQAGLRAPQAGRPRSCLRVQPGQPSKAKTATSSVCVCVDLFCKLFFFFFARPQEGRREGVWEGGGVTLCSPSPPVSSPPSLFFCCVFYLPSCPPHHHHQQPSLSFCRSFSGQPPASGGYGVGERRGVTPATLGFPTPSHLPRGNQGFGGSPPPPSPRQSQF